MAHTNFLIKSICGASELAQAHPNNDLHLISRPTLTPTYCTIAIITWIHGFLPTSKDRSLICPNVSQCVTLNYVSDIQLLTSILRGDTRIQCTQKENVNQAERLRVVVNLIFIYWLVIEPYNTIHCTYTVQMGCHWSTRVSNFCVSLCHLGVPTMLQCQVDTNGVLVGHLLCYLSTLISGVKARSAFATPW